MVCTVSGKALSWWCCVITCQLQLAVSSQTAGRVACLCCPLCWLLSLVIELLSLKRMAASRLLCQVVSCTEVVSLPTSGHSTRSATHCDKRMLQIRSKWREFAFVKGTILDTFICGGMLN